MLQRGEGRRFGGGRWCGYGGYYVSPGNLKQCCSTAMGDAGLEHKVGRKYVATPKPYDIIGILIIVFKNYKIIWFYNSHINSYGC